MQTTRHEQPPSGGIFLPKELTMPTLVAELVPALPYLRQQSRVAQAALDDMFRVDIETELNVPELSPYARYLHGVRQLIQGSIYDETERLKTSALVERVEDLKETAGRFDDAKSTICKFGQKTVQLLLEHSGSGLRIIAGQYYEIVIDHTQTRWFCGFDAQTDQTIYYNRWDKVVESNYRQADLDDYLRLLNDVAREQALLASSKTESML